MGNVEKGRKECEPEGDTLYGFVMSMLAIVAIAATAAVAFRVFRLISGL